MSEQLDNRTDEIAIAPRQSEDDRRIAEYLYSDPLLSLIGFFDAGYKRRKPTAEVASKRVALSDGRTFETVPATKYGFPNTEDQDWLHGFERLMLDRMVRRTDYTDDGAVIRRPHVQLPITYHLREHIRASGKTECASTVRSAREWVRRMSATTIEGAIAFGEKNKRSVEGLTHLFRQATLIGERLPDGTTAHMVHVWPENWFLSRLAYLQAQLLDHTLYQQLGRFAYAKQLLPVLYNAFYATDGKPWRKSYHDLCTTFGLTIFEKPARRMQQLDPGHRQLHKRGVLKSWGWAHGAIDAVLTFTPGPKYFEDLAARSDRRARAKCIDAKTTEAPAAAPAPTRPKPARTGNPYNLTAGQVPEAEHMADAAVEKIGHRSHRRLFFMIAAKAITGNYVTVFWKVLSETAEAVARPNHTIRHVPKYFASGVEAQAGQRDLITEHRFPSAQPPLARQPEQRPEPKPEPQCPAPQPRAIQPAEPPEPELTPEERQHIRDLLRATVAELSGEMSAPEAPTDPSPAAKEFTVPAAPK
jgi:hypothetical protein